MPLDPHFHAMLEAQAAAAPADVPPMEKLPPAFLRQMYREQRTAQNQATSPSDVETRDLKATGPAGEIATRLYTPADAATPGALLVYFHGGGWVIGDLETHDAHCRRLAAYSGARVLAVDYRLAPENPFPASHDDALAATCWAFDHAGEIGVDPARIGVGGDSAGGNLAAAVAHDLKTDPQRRLKFQLLIYPATGPAERTASRRERDGPVLSSAAMDFFEAALAAHAHPHGRRATPAQAEDLSGLPPALVITAGFDPLEDEGRDYAAALAAAGVPARHVSYPSMVHDFFIMGDVSPAVVEAARETAQALREAL
ncbi:MAG TPA: alpha/beta hydrolase [Caulobacteraceae bacterium]|jgi:acetyl esterase|nr:alpha/beta hydrolase [Caulobacteraceae bacterium]